jgi:ParB-like chromosome segregation protein Spo0J
MSTTEKRSTPDTPAATDADVAVELWPIERPIPYAKNPRTCPETAIAKVAASLKEFGFRQPIVVGAQDVVVVGHTRLLAARRLGLKTVPVHVARDLSPAQAQAYRLADNRTNQETAWDSDLLSLEISELIGLDYDIDVVGFDPDEISALLLGATAGKTDPDLVPELPAEPTTKHGDLWLLGDHRLLCGDATKAADVARLMGDERAAAMVTDPPYLMNYDGSGHPQSWANKPATRDKNWDAYHDHEQAVAFYVSFLKEALEHALTPDAAVYECYAILRSEFIWQAWKEVGLLPHQVVIWKKSRSVLTHSWFLWNYEPVMVGWPAGHQPERKPPTRDSEATAGNGEQRVVKVRR